MAVNLPLPIPSQLRAIKGIQLGIAQAGVRKPGRDDLTIIRLEPGAHVAGVFTTNRFCAAPVQICRQHLAVTSSPRAILINTGNANAGTGEEGVFRGHQCCEALARRMGIREEEVLPFSTGVIMEQLPVERIVSAIPVALETLKPDNWFAAARAIMTTDTQPKAFSAVVDLGPSSAPVRINITGISKGAGMIRPNMATMLSFLAMDACIDANLLGELTRDLADASFNRVTIDGDTSTNDSFVLIATNQAGNPEVTSLLEGDGLKLKGALLDISCKLAQAIVRDAEGATKFITIDVSGGRDNGECQLVSYAIAHSPLVKTAFFASDPNLGRILAAIGYAGIEDLDQTKIELYLDDVHVVTRGGRHPQYLEEDGQRVMRQQEIRVSVGLGRGIAKGTVWTCDLSHEYVSINADYRS